MTDPKALGQQLLRTDYVTSAVDTAVTNAQNGNYTPVDFSRQLRDQGKVSYVIGFAVDLVVNPARAFQGSIAGSVSITNTTNSSTPIGYNTYSINVRAHDAMSASSATHEPPKNGTYGPSLTPNQPYGPTGPMRTIDVNYNVNVTRTLPAPGNKVTPSVPVIPLGY